MLIRQLFEGYKQSEPTAVFNMPTTVFVSRKAVPEQEQRVDNITKWAAENGINMTMLRMVLNPLNPSFGRPLKGWRFRLPGQPFPLPPFKLTRTPSRNPKDGRYRVQMVGSSLSKIVTIRQWARDNEIKPAELTQAINKQIPVSDGLGRKWMVSKVNELAEARRKSLQNIPQEPRDHVIIYNGFALEPILLTKSEAEAMATRDSDLVLSIQAAYDNYINDPHMGRNIYKMALAAGIIKE